MKGMLQVPHRLVSIDLNILDVSGSSLCTFTCFVLDLFPIFVRKMRQRLVSLFEVFGHFGTLSACTGAYFRDLLILLFPVGRRPWLSRRISGKGKRSGKEWRKKQQRGTTRQQHLRHGGGHRGRHSSSVLRPRDLPQLWSEAGADV